MAGPVSGHFLSLTKKGVLEGDLYGIYAADGAGSQTGTWQANAAGTYVRDTNQTVRFSSPLSGGTAQLGHVYGGSRDYGNGETYSFGYLDRPLANGEQHGWSEYVNAVDRTSIDTSFKTAGPDEAQTYYSQSVKTVWTEDAAPAYTFTQQVVTFADRAAYLQALPDLNTPLYPGREPVEGFGHYDFSIRNGAWGVFAGFADLWDQKWSPVEFMMLGNPKDMGSAPFLFGTPVISMNPYGTDNPATSSESLPGGAYFAWLGGAVDQGNQVAGTLFGLYLDRDRNLGILNSWNDETSSYSLSGASYAGTGLWEGAGRISADYILLNANELPQELTAQNFSAAMLREPEERTVFVDPGLRPWGWDQPEFPDVRLGAISRNSASLATLWPSWTLSSIFGVWQGTAGGEYSGDAAVWAGGVCLGLPDQDGCVEQGAVCQRPDRTCGYGGQHLCR